VKLRFAAVPSILQHCDLREYGWMSHSLRRLPWLENLFYQLSDAEAWVALKRRRVMPEKVNLTDKFNQIHEYWKPYIAGELNGQMVKLDKLKGEFVWHHHENEDELFLCVKGRFRIEFRDKTVWLDPGEFIVVPRMVEHRPVADEEAWILLFEPGSTLNTGNVENEMTLHSLDRV
jgi:mannose-6-phosphate isomerase-like protein (cupin superfamily)